MKKLTFLTLTALSVFALAACSTTEPSKKEATDTSVSVAQSSSEQATSTSYKVGDTIVFKDVAEITITNIAWTDERNEVSDIVVNKVLLVTYNVTNLTDKDYVVGEDMDLYVNNKVTEGYPVGTILETIAPGRSIEGATTAFAVNEEGTSELEVKPGFQFSTDIKPAIVKFDLPQ
ncbi:hypothetical protein F6P74_10840 [Streptococcus suis]|uniref:Telomeric repeat-binding factor 2 n=1 Tax=Streptococcus suis TaxID=1307 RepID=A0A2Z4PMR1_STRSU|nr:hypothetical protein [Streptococcus suis]AWX96344.1 hypothetical protein BKM66_09360 [Streptococcus suis]AWX98343.1 hypothetical protein BKM67_09900 [Streptococcus suis]MBS8056308.1 hypothetical protein [Streptococcus suis]MBS8071996.1 hypothetical protein [Streptococcus suis]MBS8094108.1 hypothetical protein [Streptococcus suis]